MKKVFFIALNIIFVFAANAQNKETKNPLKEKPVTEVKSGSPIYSSGKLSVQPEFPGGMAGFFKFVDAKIDRKIIKEGAKGNLKTYVSFVVERDGSLSDIKLLRDGGFGVGKQALAAIKQSPKWKPGELNGEKVRSLYNVPIVVTVE